MVTASERENAQLTYQVIFADNATSAHVGFAHRFIQSQQCRSLSTGRPLIRR